MASYSPVHTIVVIGHKQAGKSTLIQKLTRNNAASHIDTNSEIDTYIYRCYIGLREVVFHILEASGNLCHTPSSFNKYFNISDGIVIIHDLAIETTKSLECTRSIIKEITKSRRYKDTEIFLACNKYDRVEGRKVLKKVKRVARKYGITLFTTSGAQVKNVCEMFESVFVRIWFRTLLQDPEFNVKYFNLIIIGDTGVGKTSLVQQFSKNRFFEERIEHDEIFHTVCPAMVNNQFILLNVREGPDTDNFRSVISRYYEDIHGVILVYDVCNRNSFANAGRWITSINEMVNAPYIPKLMVGNKSDHFPDVDVAFEEANTVATQASFKLYQTSAKDDSMVFEVFNQMSQCILQQKGNRNWTQPRGCIDLFLHRQKKNRNKNKRFTLPASQQRSSFLTTPKTSCFHEFRRITLFSNDVTIEEDSESSNEDDITVQTTLSRTASEEIASLFQMEF